MFLLACRANWSVYKLAGLPAGWVTETGCDGRQKGGGGGRVGGLSCCEEASRCAWCSSRFEVFCQTLTPTRGNPKFLAPS